MDNLTLSACHPPAERGVVGHEPYLQLFSDLNRHLAFAICCEVLRNLALKGLNIPRQKCHAGSIPALGTIA